MIVSQENHQITIPLLVLREPIIQWVFKLEVDKNRPTKNKKKGLKKVSEVGGRAIILTGTESHSNFNIAKHTAVWSVSLTHF